MSKWTIYLLLGLWLNLNVAHAEIWKIAAIEDWPPYMDKTLGEKSLGYIALQEALDKIGVKAEIHFFPWNRARHIAATDSSFIGYYCAWPEEVDDGFFPSAPVFTSPIGIIHTKETPLDKFNEESLHKKTVGLVHSYIYPPFFQSAPNTQRVLDDISLIKVVSKGRVDFGIIDQHVFDYHMKNAKQLQNLKTPVFFDLKTILEQHLVIAFKDTPENKSRSERLTKALYLR